MIDPEQRIIDTIAEFNNYINRVLIERLMNEANKEEISKGNHPKYDDLMMLKIKNDILALKTKYERFK
jgi:hypothetical protein